MLASGDLSNPTLVRGGLERLKCTEIMSDRDNSGLYRCRNIGQVPLYYALHTKAPKNRS